LEKQYTLKKAERCVMQGQEREERERGR